MERFIKLIMLVLVTGSTIAYAEPIMLSDQRDIQSAYVLTNSIAAISTKVMACINEPGGSVQACVCNDLDTCKFKNEFRNAASAYCKIKMDYPSWKGQSVNFYMEDTAKSHTLGMEGLERQFGPFCK